MELPNFLQLQTEAAYQSLPPRPQANPVQPTAYPASLRRDSSSLSSATSTSSSSPRLLAKSPTPPIDVGRCTRCKRAVSMDATGRESDVICFGSLRYCQSCVRTLEGKGL